MAAVADAVVIGEGEETVQHVLDTIYREESKQERLAALAQVPGVYVPACIRRSTMMRRVYRPAAAGRCAGEGSTPVGA